MNRREKLVQYVKDGDSSNALTLVKELVNEVEPKEIIDEIRELDDKSARILKKIKELV